MGVYTLWNDSQLADLLHRRMEAQGLPPKVSIGRAGALIREAVAAETPGAPTEMPHLSTERTMRVVHAWLPVSQAEAAKARAAAGGDGAALEAARAAEAKAREYAEGYGRTRRKAERKRSEKRRDAAALQGRRLPTDVGVLLIEAVQLGRADEGAKPEAISARLLEKFRAMRAAAKPAAPPKRKAKRPPADRKPHRAAPALPADQEAPPPGLPVGQDERPFAHLPDDQYTVRDDPRQTSIPVDREEPDALPADRSDAPKGEGGGFVPPG